MAKRAIYFDEPWVRPRGFPTQLRSQGFDLIKVEDQTAAGREILSGECDIMIFGGGSDEEWRLCQSLVTAYPDFPVLYILVNDDPRRDLIRIDELHQIIRPLSSRSEFMEKIESLIRIGKVFRKVNDLSKLATGSLALDQMYTQLDVHHILDRTLKYFGQRLDAENLHWLRWRDLSHFLQDDRETLALEMEFAITRSPRMMSYSPAEPKRVFDLLWQGLKAEDMTRLENGGYLVARVGKKSVLFVVVKSLSGSSPLGLLVVEGCPIGDENTLAPRLLETLNLMTRFIEFGLVYWDSKSESLVDDLTGLFNQRYLMMVIDNEINRSKRRNHSFSLLFMDLDHFKMVNDTRGHWIGSKLLKEIGRILKSSIRTCDFGFRYGGDEFVVVLPETDLKGGQIVAERIRKAIEETHFLIDGQGLRLTVSVGLANYPDHAKSREQIIKIADEAMYFGKRKSRNIVYIAS